MCKFERISFPSIDLLTSYGISMEYEKIRALANSNSNIKIDTVHEYYPFLKYGSKNTRHIDRLGINKSSKILKNTTGGLAILRLLKKDTAHLPPYEKIKWGLFEEIKYYKTIEIINNKKQEVQDHSKLRINNDLLDSVFNKKITAQPQVAVNILKNLSNNILATYTNYDNKVCQIKISDLFNQYVTNPTEKEISNKKYAYSENKGVCVFQLFIKKGRKNRYSYKQ
ncbi:MAG: hypothetical protein HC905_28940 [Bacteroidales bacterium]|nr:hypothetical protein [Bacteroidales bacterium]